MTASSALAYTGDVLVVVGVLLLTVAVYGVVRMPDTFLKLHAASAGVLFGLLPILAGAGLTGGREVALRAALIAVLLLLTAPISAHAITKAAYQREDAGESEGAGAGEGEPPSGPGASPSRNAPRPGA